MSDLLKKYGVSEEKGSPILAKYGVKEGTAASPPLQTFVNQGANAMLFGHGPEVVAGTARALAPLYEKVTGEKIQEFLPSYTQIRDKTYKELEAESKENPKAAVGGTITGAVLGGGPLAKLGGFVAKGAGAAARIARAAVPGAAIGALQNPGAKEGEIAPIQPTERLKGAGLGAVLGAGLQGAGEGLKLLPNVSQKLQSLSQEKAFKSTGAKMKDFQKAFGKGQVDDIGQTLLDEKIVTAGSTPAKIAQRTSVKLDAIGNRVNELITKADDFIGGPAIDNEQLLAKIQATLPGMQKGKIGSTALRNKLNETFTEIAENGKEISLKRAWEIKQDIDEQLRTAYKNKTFDSLSGWEDALLGIRNQVRDAIDKTVEGVGPSIGAGANELKTQLRKYGAIKEAQRISEREMARNAGNRTWSITDILSLIAGSNIGRGGAGAAAGYAVGGDQESAFYGALIGAGGSKLLRTYGNPVAAKSAQLGAKASSALERRLGKLAIQLGASDPASRSNVVQQLLDRAEIVPQRLKDAAKKDDNSGSKRRRSY